MTHLFKVYLLAVFSLFLIGCGSTKLPSYGPSKSSVKSESRKSKQNNIQLIEISSSNIGIFGPAKVKSISSEFRDVLAGKHKQILGIGDQILISIWEASGDGLFSTTEKKQTDIGAVVDEEGLIYIPYVGSIKVSQKSIEDVREIISIGLKGKALEPEVQVKLLKNVSNTIVAIGEVSKPGMYPIPVGGIRLLEALSQAGGSEFQSFESLVSVVSSENSAEIRLSDILADQSNDIWLKPGDTLKIIKSPKVFTALGAIRIQKKYTFENQNLTLSEALAQAGGLIDDISDSSGVFLFRLESASFMKNCLSKAFEKEFVPVIYQIDLSKAESFFLASQFMLLDKDLIYVSTAPARDYNKFLDTFVKPLLDLGRTGITINREIQ